MHSKIARMPRVRSILNTVLFGLLSAASSRGAVSDDGVWRDPDAAELAGPREIWIEPDRYRTVVLEKQALQAILARAPQEFPRGEDVFLTLPRPDGAFATFIVRESPIMEPELAAKFPEIKTYIGQGVDDPAATLRLDMTPAGFHAQVLSPGGAYYIDPRFRNDTENYASYYKRDYPRPHDLVCLTPPGPTPWLDEVRLQGTSLRSGETLRTYRLAVGATGEFTGFHGGTVAAGMAAIVTIVNRVTGIYENDFAVRLVLVANNNLIVYTNAGTDPYTNNDGGTMLGQNQSTCNSVIGAANYDVGHAFSTGGGGIAALGAVCRSNKAQGVSGLPNPVGDPFSVDYVAHEMGHQFGGNHPFNGALGSCAGVNRNASTAYEPGSGSTIMAYAGICGADNLQSNSDPYFHTVSFDEIRAYVSGSFGNTCAAPSSTGNTDPTVSAGADYSIPKGTPFILTASGGDPDGDTVTYCWEQRDLGPAQTLSAADNGTSPIIRSFNPTTNPTRIIPRLSNLLNNTFAAGEKLPSVNRTMDFRVMIRDNRAGGGGAASDNMVVNVVAAAGPFQVTFPNSAGTVFGPQPVTWSVAGTNLSPINAASVNILLSTDGGNTWPTTLAANTPNDGNEVVVLPGISTSSARIKVEAAGNIFFDISNTNFTIVPCPSPAAPAAESSPVAKVRYISFVPQNVNQLTALRVVLSDLPPPFDGHNGEVRWVGPPTLYPDAAHPGQDFWAAPLQCDPHFRDWGILGTINVYGVEIVPNAVYDVQSSQCDAGNTSSSLPVATSLWGDVAPTFGLNQPDIVDVAAVVDAFRELTDSVVKVRAQLNGDSVDPGSQLSILEVARAVDAFRGIPYSFSGPGTCGP